MSNEMFQGDTEFRIPREKEEDAYRALMGEAIGVVQNDNIRAGDIREMLKDTGRDLIQLTLDELVECWGWLLIRDLAGQTDEIIDIELQEDSSTDEESLFGTLAPFVVAGSYITLNGKGPGGGHWEKRYGFTGKRVVELEAEFPPIPIEEGRDESPGQARLTLMAGCPHTKVTIQFYEQKQETYHFEDGHCIDSEEDWESVPLPEIGVTCQHCLLDIHYPEVAQAPQWVQDYHHRIAHWENMEEVK